MSQNYYRPSFGGFQFFPPVIKFLLITNTAIFLFEGMLKFFHIAGTPLSTIFSDLFALMPLGGGFYPWQLITYQFMHADLLHLLFNMFFGLWMFGMEIENMWGAKKFLIYYLSCGVAAGLSQLFFAPIFEQTLGPTIGASGAVYGVFVAFARIFPERYVFFMLIIPVKVKYLMMFLIVMGVVSIGGDSNIANLAHLGGAAAGYLYLLYEKHRLVDNRRKTSYSKTSFSWSKSSTTNTDVVDAKIYDIKESKTYESKTTSIDNQKRIDEILDKISRSGYQNLTDEEKKILFEASKRMN